jgi:hypothetical protein
MAAEIQRVQVNVRMMDEYDPILVNAFTTPTAGLVVHPSRRIYVERGVARYVRRRNHWSISIYPIGVRVFSGIPTREQAEEIIAIHLTGYQWVGLFEADIFATNDRDKLKEMGRNVRKIIQKQREALGLELE